jgi:AraC family transcriptional regulator
MLEPRRLDALDAGGVQWSPEALQAALDIRAPNLRRHFLRLASEAASPSFAAPLIADAVLVLMVSDLLAYLAPSARAENAGGDVAAHALRRVRDRIYDFDASPPTVMELAELCDLSERHLLRLFRREQGVSLIEFVREARLERAMELLSTTDWPLKVVAHRLGFSSHASFTAAFAREAGVSPTAFRRERRRSYPVRPPRDGGAAQA